MTALAAATGCEGYVERVPPEPSEPPATPVPEPAVASCDDGLQNGQEASVDCGGPECAPCVEPPPCAGPGSCSGEHIWSTTVGGDQTAWIAPRSVATDPAGNIAVAGTFTGTLDLGSGPLESTGDMSYFVAGFDGDGQPRWSARIETTDSYPHATLLLAMDGAGNTVAAGTFQTAVSIGGEELLSEAQYSAFVTKLDAEGHPLWIRRLGGASPVWVEGVAVDGGGDIILSGGFKDTVDLGGEPFTSPDGHTGAFVVKLDPSGEHIWSQGVANTWDMALADVAVDGEGSILLGGYFSGSVDLGGGPLESAGGAALLAAKLDADGQHIWSERFQLEGGGACEGVAVDGAGRLVIGGRFQGSLDLGGGPLTSTSPSNDMVVAQLDPAGVHLWSRGYGASELMFFEDVAADAHGNVVAAGRFAGTADLGDGPVESPGAERAFLVKLGEGGELAWSKQAASAGGSSMLTRVAIDPAGNVVVIGSFAGAMDLGGGLLEGGDGAMFFAKFAP